MSAFRYLDLFSGIGGFRLALDRLDGECVASIEHNKPAVETYLHNFGETDGHIMFDREVGSISAQDIPPFDLLAAGFPCQAFSIANIRAIEKGYDRPDGSLFFEIARILDYRRPAGFILENVSSLDNAKNVKIFKNIMSVLRDSLGYYTMMIKLNAVHFVPQTRKRIFIVGFKRRNEMQYLPPSNICTELRIRDLLESDAADRYYQPADYHHSMIKRHLECGSRVRLNCDNIGSPNIVLFAGNNNFPKLALFDPGQILTTIVAQIYSPSPTRPMSMLDLTGASLEIARTGNFDGFKNLRMRSFTPNELLRAQGFMKPHQTTFSFPLNIAHGNKYRMIGNAVCPQCVEHIVRQMLPYLHREMQNAKH